MIIISIHLFQESAARKLSWTELVVGVLGMCTRILWVSLIRAIVLRKKPRKWKE